MGKYSQSNLRQPKTRVEHPHPIWRGIGCILMIVVPIISFGLADLTIQSSWAQQYIPYQLLGNPVLPSALFSVGFLNPALVFIQNQENLYGLLLLLIFYIIVIGALVSVGNAFLYRAIAPPRYGPQDAPPPKIKVRRYKR